MQSYSLPFLFSDRFCHMLCLLQVEYLLWAFVSVKHNVTFHSAFNDRLYPLCYGL